MLILVKGILSCVVACALGGKVTLVGGGSLVEVKSVTCLELLLLEDLLSHLLLDLGGLELLFFKLSHEIVVFLLH
jgi:hypothetical protein